jgi:hypothetical protein
MAMRNKRFYKWFLLGLGILVFASIIFVTFFLKDLLIQKLSNELKHTFHNYYTIQYASLKTSLSLNGLNITIDKPRFKSDTSLHALNRKFPALFFKADKLIVRDLSVRKLLFTDELKLDEILLKQPKLIFIVFSVDTTTLFTKTKKHKPKKRNYANFLHINKISFTNGSLVCCYNNQIKDTTFLGININAIVENIDMQVSKLKTLAYNLRPENNFSFSASRSYYRPFQSNFSFYLDSLVLSDKKKIISAKNIAQITNRSKLDISKTLQYVKTITEATIGSFKLRGYDIKQILDQKSMVIQSMTLNAIELNMFRNKQKQFDLKSEKLLIQEMITELPFKLKLDSIIITNSKIHFELLYKNSQTPFVFYINKLNAVFTHLNTLNNSYDTMMLAGNGTFMDVANFNVQAGFPNIHSPHHFYSGKVGTMPFSKFNTLLFGYAGIKITSGAIKSIAFNGICNQFENRGRVTFKYNDLEIGITKHNGKKKAKLISFLGNMVLQNNNPRNEHERATSVNYYFRREKYQSHTMLWIGGILEGVKNTLIRKNIQEKGKKFMKNKK